MKGMARDEIREERIEMDIIVDAYGPEEQAMGWYSYLEDTLSFPFDAECIDERSFSPLRIEEEVEVLEMASEEDCENEMFVLVRRRNGEEIAVPLAMLEPIDGDDETQESVEDWRYWVKRGYRFE